MFRVTRHLVICAMTLLLSLGSGGPGSAQTASAQPALAAPVQMRGHETAHGVQLRWLNSAKYDSLQILRNGDPIATLPGDASDYFDGAASTGCNHYDLLATTGGISASPIAHTVLVAGDRTDLIWAPAGTVGGLTDSARMLYRTLQANGRHPLRITTLPAGADLAPFDSVWVTLGTFPYNHVLTPQESQVLLDYTSGPERVLYLEGGDTWFDDPATPLHDLFGAYATDGGDADLTTQFGTTNLCLIVLDADYVGEQESIDRLAPSTHGVPLLRNDIPAYDTVVLRQLPHGSYTVAASHEFGGLEPIAGDLAGLMELYLDCLDIRRPHQLELHSIAPIRGLSTGGERVTLQGSFSRQTQVFFGGVPATNFVYIDHDTVEVVAPANVAGLVDVTASDALGSTSLLQAFEYLPAPIATHANSSSGALAFGPGNMPTVQSGTLSTNGNGVFTATIAAVDTSRAFLIFNARHNNSDPDGSMLRGRIASSTSVEFARVTNGGDVIDVQWYVVEYPAGVISVQRGTIPTMNSTTIDVGITPVDLDQAFVTWSKTPAATDSSWGSNDPILMELTATDNLQLRVAGTHSAHVIWWQVVEFTNAADILVQRGTTSLTAGLSSVDVTLGTAIDTDQTFLMTGFTSGDGGSDIGSRMLRGQVIDSDTIRFDRDLTSDDIDEIAWQVVELRDGSTVQRGSASFASGVSQTSEALTAVDLTRAVAFASAQPDAGLSMGKTAYSGNDITGVGCATLSLSTTSVTLERNNTSSTADIGWFVVEWGSGILPPSIATVSPNNGTPFGGDTVTITGSEFTADAVVSFDGIAAATTFVNTNTLTATTPAHASGSVDVTVAGSTGSDTLSNGFTYNPAPSLSAVSPTSGTPLGGDTLTVTGSSFTADASLTVDGVAVATTFVNSTTLTAVTVAHAPGTVDVAVSNLNGSDSLSNAFTFLTPPAITTIAPTSGTPLGGETLTVTGTNFTADATIAIDGAVQTTTFVSATTLTAVTPAHAPGAVDVTVASVNGSDTLSNGFTYQQPPDITGVLPNDGSPLGGDSVTITGSNFTAGTTVAFDGVTIPTTFVNTVTLTVTTPPHAPGFVPVSVTNANGSDTLAFGFTYNNPPSISSVAPSNGTPLGGDTVTVSGSNFTPTTTVSFDGIAAATTYVTTTSLTAVTPAHATGTVDVAVANVNGTDTLAAAFTYDAGPVLTSLTPTNGPPAGGVTVTVTGSNFTADATVSFDGTNATTSFVNSTTLTASSPAHAPGTVNVTVTSINGSSTLTAAFTYDNPPSISSISPANGTPLGGDTVNVSGADFTPSTTVSIDGATVATTFLSATTLTAVTAAHAPGTVDVAVANVNGADTLPNAFTFDSPPDVTGVTPSNGSPLGAENITVSGANFTADAVVFIDGIAAATTFVSSTTLTATTPAHAPGVVNVSVSNINGSDTVIAAFNYDNPPSLASLAPTNGSPLGGDTVTVTGADFTPDATVTVDGTAVATTYVNATTLTITTLAHAPGAVDVAVSSLNGSDTLLGAFTYDEPPTLTAVNPNNGPPAGGQTVTVTGTNFTADAVVAFDGIAATTTFVSATSLTALTPAHSNGVVDVSVSNLNGSATLAAIYTYNDAPSIASLAPANGTPLGGDTVTITGSGFTGDAAVTFDGITAATTFVSTTTLTVITPAHAPGTVDVMVTNINGSDTLAAGFIYDTPPILTSVSPASGTPLGGDTLTISGANFTPDTTATVDGMATATTFVNTTTVTVVTAPHAPGAVDIAVTNTNGSATLTDAFTFNAPPTIATVSPSNGSPLGMQTITVTGTGFTPDAVVAVDGMALSTIYVSPTTLLATTLANAPGVVDVAVSNVNGSATLAGSFTYDSPPTIQSVTPNSGTPLGGEVVTVTGTNYTPGTLALFGGVVAATTFVDATTLTATTPAHVPGSFVVNVVNTNGSGSLFAGYTYDDYATIAAAAPSSGTPLGGTAVTLTGTGFTGTTSVTFGGVPAASVTFVNSTTLIAVTAPQASGTVNIVIANANGTDTLTGGFTFDSVPAISSVAPSAGTPFGGDTLTVVGTNFTADAVVSIDGTNLVTTFVSPTILTAVTAAHAPGTENVTVTNVNGSATLPGAFTFDSPPTLATVAPLNGTPLGGDLLTLTGANFTASTSVTIDGAATPATFVSSTTLTVVTAPHAPGTVDVAVANVNGSDTLSGAFTYDSPPALTSVAPANGTPLGGDTLTLTGSAFTLGTDVLIDGSVAVSTFVSSTTLTVVTPAHAPGSVDVAVTNVNGSATLAASFTYDAPPQITSVAPSVGTALGGQTVTVNGSNFTADAAVAFDGVTAATSFVDSNTLTAITPAHAAGAIDVSVMNLNGTATLATGYNYVDPPTLASVSPTSGSPLGGEIVTISGANFTLGSVVTVDGTAAAASFVDSGTITITTPPHAPGAVDIGVSNSIGSDTLSLAFTYNTPPGLTAVTPTNGTPLGGDTLTISGTNLTADSVVSIDGTAVATTFVSATTLTAVTVAHAPGLVDISVANVNGASVLASSFTFDNPPSVTSVSPGAGSPLGGQTITISGVNFTADATVSFDGIAAATTFVDSMTLSAVTPAHAPGAVDVTVTNLNGSATLSGGFAFNGPPVATGISPSDGSQVGGDTVTITGTGFIGDETVTFDGIAATTVNFINGSTITAETPPHTAGFVDVAVSNVNGTSTLVGAFEYLSTPTITSLSPTEGSSLGGTTVTLTGSNYIGGETVTFDGIPAPSVTLINSTTLDVVTPPHAPGAVTVAVSNVNGSGALPLSFTYEAPPALSGLTPPSGSPLGVTTVVVMGSGFDNATVVTFDGLLPATTTFIDSSNIEVVAPAHIPGFVDVTVTNSNGSDTALGAFLYESPPQTLFVAPIVGTSLGGDTVTVTGMDFTPDSVVLFGATPAATTYIDATTLEAVTPPQPGGLTDVSVTNANGNSVLPNAFTFQATLFVTVVTPGQGPVAGGTTVSVVGTGFQGNEVVLFDGIPATSLTLINAGQLEAVTPAHAAGSVDVDVVGPVESATLPNGFVYVAPPTLTSITPSGGDVGGGNIVNITGTNLGSVLDTTIMFGANPASVSSVALDQSSAILISPPGPPGFADVTVTTAGGSATITDGFLYSSGVFTRGDSNQDNQINLADAIFNLSYLFANGAAPLCFDAADTNDDSFIDLADVIYLVSFLFANGSPPPTPFEVPGPDPTLDTLNCLN